MRIAIALLMVLIVLPESGHGAARTWKFRNGAELKAEFIGGVLDNKIVLKGTGNRRYYFRLSEFCLEDRDYIVDYFARRDRPEDQRQLQAMMAAENNVRAIDPHADPDDSFGGNSRVRKVDRGPFNPLAQPNPAPENDVPTEMYGIALPSPELLVEDQVRTWTSLTGQKLLFRFERALAPGHFRLKKSDGSAHDFAMVNFSTKDIDYVKQLLQADLARPVFPETDGFQSLTPEDVSRGYRVWTDRRNVTLIGKFMGTRGDDVVIEVAGLAQEYPKAGLSESDRTWVDGEVRRRAEAARAAAEQAAANNPRPRNPWDRSNRFEHEDRTRNLGHGGMGRDHFPRLEYRFECEHCGRTWTDNMPVSRCEHCAGKFHFHCRRCGHKWTRTDRLIDNCPRCSGKLDDSGSSDSSSSHSASSTETSDSNPLTELGAGSSGEKEKQGVLMTIVYVLAGVALLAFIASTLFRAFD